MYRKLKDIVSLLAAAVFIIAMSAACAGGAGVASNPRPGHWTGGSVSFDVMPDSTIHNLKMTADTGSGTCTINLAEFERQSDGTFAFGDPAKSSQTAQYITGKFATDTTFNGKYKISVCKSVGDQYSVSLVAEEQSFSATWASDMIATEEPTAVAQPLPTETSVVSQPTLVSVANSSTSRTVTLAEAIAQDLVQARLTGTGSASGSSVELTLRSKVSDSLTITIEPGMTLLNSNSDEQNMVVRRLLGLSADSEHYLPRDVISLSASFDADQTYLLEAYCLDVHKDNPGSGTEFSIGGQASEDVLAVLNALDRVSMADSEVDAVQASIWAVVSDVTWDELDDLGYSTDHDLVRSIIAAAGFDPDCNQLFGKHCGGAAASPTPDASTPVPTTTPRPEVNVLGAQIGKFFSPGPSPVALAISADSVWVADSQQNRIYRLDRTGAQIGSFPIKVNGYIHGLAWDGETLRLLTGDYSGNGQIRQLSQDGKTLGTMVLPVQSTGLAWNPVDDTFWTIADQHGTGFLLEFKSDGHLLRSFASPIFGGPEALAWAPDGLWVLSVFGKWHRFSFNGDYLSSDDLAIETFADDPALAWDETGSLWLSVKSQHAIYQYGIDLAEADLEIPPEMQTTGRQSTGELPLPDATFEVIPGKERSSVSVINQLSVPLNVSLDNDQSGSVHESSIVAPGETWTITVDSGVYTLFASANAPTPLAFLGKVLLIQGYGYTWAFSEPAVD